MSSKVDLRPGGGVERVVVLIELPGKAHSSLPHARERAFGQERGFQLPKHSEAHEPGNQAAKRRSWSLPWPFSILNPG